ncbi:hypothetical protein ACHWQZ_G006227 [Mnemiopsis leidyi]
MHPFIALNLFLKIAFIILLAQGVSSTTSTTNTKTTLTAGSQTTSPPEPPSQKPVDVSEKPNSAFSTSARGRTFTSSIMSTTGTPAYTVPQECTEQTSGTIRNFDFVVSSKNNEGLLKKHEGEFQIITCNMKRTKSDSCNNFFDGLKNETKLFTHSEDIKHEVDDHEIYENTQTTILEGDEDYLFKVQFNFSIKHEFHHEHSIYCGATKANNSLRVISQTREFPSIDISIYPKQVRVAPNTPFTLTCSFEDVEVKHYVYWKSKKSSDDNAWVYIEGTDRNIVLNDNSSVLTIKKNEEWNGTYSCSTRMGSHPKQIRDQIIVEVKAPDKSALHGTTIALVITALVVALVLVAVFIRRRQLKKKIEISLMLMELQEAGAQQNARVGSVHSLTSEPAVNCYANALNPDGSLAAETLAATFARFTTMYAPWQKERSKLVIKNILGEGNFGSVCLGIMPDVYFQGVSSQVAVKTIKPARMDKQAITEFEKEVSIMTTLKHEHIVSLVGLCTEKMPLYIIMEYMENGQLNEFLMTKAPNKMEDTTLSTRDLLFMSLQPCKALEYLSNKNVVHRDISARNCLVGDKLSVKLADFGLSRGTAVDDGKNYYKKDGGMVPVKWMAPEALNFGKYTTANDVWSFGVLMWEIFSFGAIPYLSHSNQQVIVYVNRGGRLDKPEYCPQSIWEHICSCWTKAPEDRITIGGLVNMLSTELDIIDTTSD